MPPRFGTVFVDRDGTLNVKAAEGDYVTAPDQMRLIDGVAAGVRRLNEAACRVFVVSNQRCVARGLVSDEEMTAINARLESLLRSHGAHVDGIYVCPHDDGECDCRKPLPGLLLRAAGQHPEVRLADSVLIGDAETDVQAAAAAGVTAVRLAPAGSVSAAERVVTDFGAAVDWVLSVS